MIRGIFVRRKTDWRVGDKALVEERRGEGFEARVEEIFRISEDDADKIRIRYPFIRTGDLMLILVDSDGKRRPFAAADPLLMRIVTGSPTPGESAGA